MKSSKTLSIFYTAFLFLVGISFFSSTKYQKAPEGISQTEFESFDFVSAENSSRSVSQSETPENTEETVQEDVTLSLDELKLKVESEKEALDAADADLLKAKTAFEAAVEEAEDYASLKEAHDLAVSKQAELKKSYDSLKEEYDKRFEAANAVKVVEAQTSTLPGIKQAQAQVAVEENNSDVEAQLEAQRKANKALMKQLCDALKKQKEAEEGITHATDEVASIKDEVKEIKELLGLKTDDETEEEREKEKEERSKKNKEYWIAALEYQREQMMLQQKFMLAQLEKGLSPMQSMFPLGGFGGLDWFGSSMGTLAWSGLGAYQNSWFNNSPMTYSLPSFASLTGANQREQIVVNNIIADSGNARIPSQTQLQVAANANSPKLPTLKDGRIQYSIGAESNNIYFPFSRTQQSADSAPVATSLSVI
ncbi:MAG: hypothetical protein ACPGJV_16020 [Bacteriovoracaceae bacterium]